MKKMHKKYLNEPPGWILCTIMKELNLSNIIGSPSLDELRDHRDTTSAYWRQNCGQYPPKCVWDIFRLDLLN
jgi:hypothetical protein